MHAATNPALRSSLMQHGWTTDRGPSEASLRALEREVFERVFGYRADRGRDRQSAVGVAGMRGGRQERLAIGAVRREAGEASGEDGIPLRRAGGHHGGGRRRPPPPP